MQPLGILVIGMLLGLVLRNLISILDDLSALIKTIIHKRTSSIDIETRKKEELFNSEFETFNSASYALYDVKSDDYDDYNEY